VVVVPAWFVVVEVAELEVELAVEDTGLLVISK